MLCDESNRSHHRYSTMFDLGDTQLPEALLVAHLGKPERIKESKRFAGTELLGRLEEWRHIFLNHGLSPSHHALLSHDSGRGGSCEAAAGRSGDTGTADGGKPELLNGVLAGGHLCGEDSENRDHCHAPVVELLHPHLVVVHVHAEGVPVVARLLAGWRIKKNISIKN